MRDSNQTPPPEPPLLPPTLVDHAFEIRPEAVAGAATVPDGRPRIPLPRALLVWLALLLGFGVGGSFLGQGELGMLTAFAGIFIAANVADVDRGWRELYYALGWVVPAAGFFFALAVAAAIWKGPLPLVEKVALVSVASVGAGVAVFTAWPEAARVLSKFLFGDPEPHRLHLTARCVVIPLALVLPGWFAAQQMLESLLHENSSLMDQTGLTGSLLGYALLAFAGVGTWVRRSFGDACARLGLRLPGARDLLVAGVALGALWLLNTGADFVQQRWFPGLWASDRHITEAIAAGLTPARAVLLGLSAGIGEEITLRGALQPRLGIPLTAAFFAALHVQYSWFGMLVIFLLGVLLGQVRKRTNTTVAILAHVAYDVIAVLGGK